METLPVPTTQTQRLATGHHNHIQLTFGIPNTDIVFFFHMLQILPKLGKFTAIGLHKACF